LGTGRFVPMNAGMFRLRERLQSYYLQESTQIVRGLAYERGADLAEALKALEEREIAIAVVEERMAAIERRLQDDDGEDESGPAVDRLLARLDDRERALRQTRDDFEGLQRQLAESGRKSEALGIELAELRAELARRAQEPTIDPTLQAEVARLREELRARQQAEAESAGTSTDLSAWAEQLAERQSALERRERFVREAQSHESRRHELDALAAVLAERQAELDERTKGLDEDDEQMQAQRRHVKRQEERLAQIEEDLAERLKELQLREDELEEAAARREFDFNLREDKLDEDERRVAELEERLERRQADLAAYVAQAQQELAGRDRLYPRVVADAT
jgi:chromosome segregation ATPase